MGHEQCITSADFAVRGAGLLFTFNSDPDAVTGTIDADASATIVAIDGETARSVAIAVQRTLVPFGQPARAFDGQMNSISRTGTMIIFIGRTNTTDALSNGDEVLAPDDLPTTPGLTTQNAP